MNSEEYKLNEIHNYIDNKKKYAYKDIFHLENQVLNKNPYTSDFIKKYLFSNSYTNPSLFFIVKNIFLFYIKIFTRFFIYLLGFLIFKTKYKKNRIDFSKKLILVDTFFLVDKIISEKQFNEKYFIGIYDVLDKYNMQYVFFPRLYGISKNPFKIIGLLDVLKNDKNIFLYEYELLSLKDLFRILIFILKYPFKTLQLLQKNNTDIDKLFNYEIINSLPSTSFNAYLRYLVGKKISKMLSPNSKIISWQEFQNLEKTFNKAIKESENNITIYGCQFLIQYQNYISMHIGDIDYELNITPHLILSNGKYNYNFSNKQSFKDGVSLRYKNIFEFEGVKKDANEIVVLLTYEIKESIRLLDLISYIDEEVKIKIHPATNKKQFIKYLNKNWKFVDTNVYDLFYNTKIVFVASMSGTALEAVACGVSVIIIGSNDNITANPLIDYGKGKIWDIAFSKDDVKKLYNQLTEYKNNNTDEIKEIVSWYKDNFFIEPTEENIIKAFDLDKD